MPTAVVTGANRGIGLALTKELQGKGYEVIAICRHLSDELKKLEVEVIDGVDIRNQDQLDMAKQKIGDRRIDVLVNNAGVLHLETVDHLDIDSIGVQIEVNALGPLRVTSTFLSNLKEGSKIVMITSQMGSIADNSSGGYYGYRMSKAALNMGAVSLAHDLKPMGIGVYLFHPGYVSTDMTDHQGNIQPKEAAKNIVQRLEELSLDESGTFWHARGEKLPW